MLDKINKMEQNNIIDFYPGSKEETQNLADIWVTKYEL